MTSLLSVSVFGLPSLAPQVSAARTAKPSTLERSNGGASTAATTSPASTRVRTSASATDSAGSGERTRCRSKRARASSADTTSRNCSWRAAARTRAIRSLSPSDRCFRDSLTLQHSWPRSYLNKCACGITLTVGRHQYPAIRARERRKGQIFRRQRLRFAGVPPYRHDFRQTHGGTDLARERHRLCRLAFTALGRREPIEQAAPGHEPDAERGVEPSRQKQYGADADKTKRTGFTRRQRDAVHCEPPFSRERLHAVVVTPAAGPPDCDNCIRAFGGHGDTEPPAAVVQSCCAASALDVSRHQTRRGVDDPATTHGNNANARLAHRYARNAGCGKCGKISETQSFAGAPERNRWVAITASRKHTVTRIDRNERLRKAVGDFHCVDRRDTVGSRRQRLSGLDTRWRAHKRRWRITACSKSFVGADRPAILQCERRGRTSRCQRVDGKRATHTRRHIDRTLGDGLHLRIDHQLNIGKRREP